MAALLIGAGFSATLPPTSWRAASPSLAVLCREGLDIAYAIPPRRFALVRPQALLLG